MPIPTTSPAWMVVSSMSSSDSSTMIGSPHSVPVAAARTKSQRGVMTATPNETWLGLIRWMRGCKLPGLSGGRDANVLRALPTDGVVQQLEDHTVADLEIEELAFEVGFMKKDVAVRSADHAAGLPAGQAFDPAGGFF